MGQQSIYDLFVGLAERKGDEVAALAKHDGAYRRFTWRDLAVEASRIARGLAREGVALGDRVCIIANTSREWVLCDLATLGAGGVTVPIYTSNVADECQYIAQNCGAVLIIAQDATQVQKLKSERARLRNVRRVVQLEGPVDAGDDWIMSFDALKSGGGPSEADLRARRADLGRQAPATIIYTSGTTGRPKGVVLSNDALLYEAEAIAQIGATEPGDTQLLYLPLAHSLGKVLVIAWLATGHILAFAESPATIMQNCAEVRPTMMAGVPRMYEKLYAGIVQRGLALGGIRARIFEEALALSEKAGEAEAERRTLGTVDSLKLGALKRTLFPEIGKRLNDALGGRMRLMISGGAPLSRKIAWLLRDAGLMVLEGYGLTETTAATTVNRPESWRIGSVGLPMPGTHLRIAEDGEVLIKGRGVMQGYWENPEATREVLDADGWLHTGDIGMIDGAGFLHITDRKKDLIVTAGGKNIAPQNLENLLKTSPLIANVVVHGDRRNFLSALITLDTDELKKLAKERGLPNGSYAELSQHPEVRRAVEGIVAGFNAQLASFETIKRFKVLEHDFTVESGELTPSLKVKRKVVNERYRKLFDAFYDEQY